MKNKTFTFITNDFCNFLYTDKTDERRFSTEEKIKEEILRIAEMCDSISFISGMEAGVDLFAAEFVLSLKENKNIYLECVFPYENAHEKLKEKDRDKFFYVAEHCDTETFIHKKRTFGCKRDRDIYMINKSDIIFVFWDKISPYTGELLQLALELNREIIYIDPALSKSVARFAI